jgi:GNAT superfamily N-acetyltransferase
MTGVLRERPDRGQCSLVRQVRIEPGGCEDWRAMAPLHYRGHNVGGMDRVFAMRYADELIGVIVYALPSAHCAPRHRALAELVDRLPRGGRLRFWNGCLRTISRVVVDPNWRGLGLSVRLVRETLPLAGVPYVEATAVMAGVHPFFERAGMVRYEVSPSPASVRLRAALDAAGLGRREARSAASLAEAVASTEAATREWLTGELARWARSYLGAKTSRNAQPTLDQACGYAARFLYSTPAYFLWSRDKTH